MTKNIEIFQTGIISRIFQIFRSHGRLGRTVILITLGLLLSIAGLILYSRNIHNRGGNVSNYCGRTRIGWDEYS
jgi:hypothetical protein